MENYWEAWEKYGVDWRRLFAWIDPAVEAFIQKHPEVKVHRYRWDAPDRELVFQSPSGGGIWNNIHLLILGGPGTYQLRFSCAAWKDLESEGRPSPRTRVWAHSSQAQEKAWAVPLGDYGEFDVRHWVQQRLFAIYDVVGSWTVLPNHGEWSGAGLVAEESASIP